MTEHRTMDARGTMRSVFATKAQRSQHPQGNTQRICLDVATGYKGGRPDWSYRPARAMRIVQAREAGREEAREIHQHRVALGDLRAQMEDLKAELAEELRARHQ